MRGPITYCIEAVDNPNMDVLSAALPRGAELRAEHRDRLLGGVTVLQGKGIDDRQRPVTLTAVPYYSWANREKGAMTVWINEAPVASTAIFSNRFMVGSSPKTSSPTSMKPGVASLWRLPTPPSSRTSLHFSDTSPRHKLRFVGTPQTRL